jgi:hypothetical protein
MLKECYMQDVHAPCRGKRFISRTFTGIYGDLVGLCMSRTMYVFKSTSCRMENELKHVLLCGAGWS